MLQLHTVQVATLQKYTFLLGFFFRHYTTFGPFQKTAKRKSLIYKPPF